MTNREAVKYYFKDEIAFIAVTYIKEFVYKCFEQFCPDWFWTAPSSTSGKYHPEITNGESGLIRHIKYAFWWAEELMRAMPVEYPDCVRAAILLHDIFKNGPQDTLENRPDNITQTHGPKLALAISEVYGKDLVYEHWIILKAIAGHMGIWTYPSYESYWETDKTALIVHLADYCASRKIDNILNKLENEKQELER